MNKDWSEINKKMQIQIKKRESYNEGIALLFSLREDLMSTIDEWHTELNAEDFCAIPFINANGYHSKTIAYSLWHIFRIEDIVAHTLIKEDEQVFFSGSYQTKTGSPIITTGNELVKEQIAAFSKRLDIDGLYQYIHDVRRSTDEMLRNITFDDMKRKISDDTREALKNLHVVSEAEEAAWLIDYWCKKDIRGLVQMPFSRHWIMHIEAGLRIKNKIYG